MAEREPSLKRKEQNIQKRNPQVSTLAGMIEEYRLKRDMSQRQLSIKAEISRRYLRQLESGERKSPSVDKVFSLMDTLKLATLDEIKNFARLSGYRFSPPRNESKITPTDRATI